MRPEGRGAWAVCFSFIDFLVDWTEKANPPAHNVSRAGGDSLWCFKVEYGYFFGWIIYGIFMVFARGLLGIWEFSCEFYGGEWGDCFFWGEFFLGGEIGKSVNNLIKS